MDGREVRESVELDVSAVAALAAIVPEAVGEDDVTGAEHRIVTHGLRERLPPDGDARSLALGQQQRLGPVAHNHHVGPLGLSVERHGILLNDALGQHPAVRNEIGDQVLPHPLFGRQHEVDSPQGIPHLHSVATAAGTQPDGRKIEFRQLGHRSIEKFP